MIAQAPGWIRAQQDFHRPYGRSLSLDEVRALDPFYEAQTIDLTRLVPVTQIANPPFYRDLELQGVQIPLDFRRMSGITFVDTVLVSQAMPVPESQWLPLLFHEMVHVVQYEQLGVETFVTEYVTGWANSGYSYGAIPLERQAYELQARFEANREVGFSVRSAVQDWLAKRSEAT